MNGNAGDKIGAAVDVSNDGMTMVASGGGFTGVTRLYEMISGSWDTVAMINSGEVVRSVSIASTGQKIVCGNTSKFSHKGQAILYSKSRNTWRRDGGTEALVGEYSYDRFGYTVGLSDDGAKLAVGTRDGQYVKIFILSNSVWSGRHRFTERTLNDYGVVATGYGKALSISQDGKKLVVGAPNSPIGGQNTGFVYFYNLVTYARIQKQKGMSAGGFYGASVSLSSDGSRAAVGGHGKDYVDLYTFSVGSYSKIGPPVVISDKGSDFGYSVSMSGDGKRAAIGAQKEFLSGKQNMGKVFILDVTKSGWNEIYTTSGESRSDQYGSAVAISENGKHVVIGAVKNDDGGTDSGEVKVFEAR